MYRTPVRPFPLAQGNHQLVPTTTELRAELKHGGTKALSAQYLAVKVRVWRVTACKAATMLTFTPGLVLIAWTCKAASMYDFPSVEFR